MHVSGSATAHPSYTERYEPRDAERRMPKAEPVPPCSARLSRLAAPSYLHQKASGISFFQYSCDRICCMWRSITTEFRMHLLHWMNHGTRNHACWARRLRSRMTSGARTGTEMRACIAVLQCTRSRRARRHSRASAAGAAACPGCSAVKHLQTPGTRDRLVLRFQAAHLQYRYRMLYHAHRSWGHDAITSWLWAAKHQRHHVAHLNDPR